MDAQQLVGDDGEQRSGYRCSRTTAGVQKPTSMLARCLAGPSGRAAVSAVKRARARTRLGPGEQDYRNAGEACGCADVRVLRVSCARVQTEELKARDSARYHGRSRWPELLFVKGGDYNVWDGAGKTGEGAEHHHGGSAGVVQGRGWPWPAGRRADRGDGEEDVEEEVDPGLNGRLRGRGRRWRRGRCSPRKKKDGPSWLSRRGARSFLGHGIGVKLGALPGGDRSKRRVKWREDED
ncbi:hypothetical protein VPH35_028039 [Triticum aestivum]